MFDCEFQADPSGLTPDELGALEAAKATGFLVRSGHRLVVLLAWQAWCRQTGKPCVIGIRTARHGIVTVDDVEVARVAVDGLETEAAKVVGQNASRALFEGVSR